MDFIFAIGQTLNADYFSNAVVVNPSMEAPGGFDLLIRGDTWEGNGRPFVKVHTFEMGSRGEPRNADRSGAFLPIETLP